MAHVLSSSCCIHWLETATCPLELLTFFDRQVLPQVLQNVNRCDRCCNFLAWLILFCYLGLSMRAGVCEVLYVCEEIKLS